jgi:hypothetical protein
MESEQQLKAKAKRISQALCQFFHKEFGIPLAGNDESEGIIILRFNKEKAVALTCIGECYFGIAINVLIEEVLQLKAVKAQEAKIGG